MHHVLVYLGLSTQYQTTNHVFMRRSLMSRLALRHYHNGTLRYTMGHRDVDAMGFPYHGVGGSRYRLKRGRGRARVKCQRCHQSFDGASRHACLLLYTTNLPVEASVSPMQFVSTASVWQHGPTTRPSGPKPAAVVRY